jgi:hypothetical protein
VQAAASTASQPGLADIDMQGHNIINVGTFAVSGTGTATFAGLMTVATRITCPGDVKFGSGSTLAAGAASLVVDNVNGLGARIMSSLQGVTTAMVIQNDRTDGNAIVFNFGASTVVGSIKQNGSTTSYNTSSDERLKEFIGLYDPEKAVAIIRADPVRDFTWKRDGAYAVGWGAQTSYAVSNDLAAPGIGEPGDENFQPWGIDQAKRTPYLWAALTAALDRIDQLTARVEALEAR